MAARTQTKAEASIDEIKRETPDAKVEYINIDMTSFESIAAAAKDFQSRSDRLDVLINNAGIMNVPWGLTKDGYEIQFGTNHMGGALLTKLLMPTLLRTAEESNSDVRVVWLSSAAHHYANLSFGIIRSTKSAGHWPTVIRYGSTKLANMVYARGLGQAYPQITSVSVHPGVIDTQLFDASRTMARKIPLIGGLVVKIMNSTMTTPVEGAKNQLWAATAPKSEVRKSYYFEPVGVNRMRGFFSSASAAKDFWAWTQAELKSKGY